MNFTEIIARQTQAEANSRTAKTMLQELSDYISPRKSNIQVQRSPGSSQTERLFDSTAPHANTLLGASMQGSLTSSAHQWFGLRGRGIEVDRDHEISLWFEDSAKTMRDEFNESNFASETNELYDDLGWSGQGATYFDERNTMKSPQVRWQGFRFKTYFPGSYSIDENEEGRVDTIFENYRMSYRAAADAWGAQNLSDQMQAKLAKTPYEMGVFMHGIFPREDIEAVHPMQRLVNKKKMPFASYWLDVEGKKVISESGYREFPVLVPRWGKASGEVIGRGPGHTAIPTIKTLNKIIELELRALAKMIDPPVMVRDEGVLGAVRLIPGGLTHVRDMESVKTLEIGGRFDISREQKEEMRAMIRRIFFTDQLQLQEGPQMTAYEVQVRYELMQRILGPTLGRLEVEFLNPLIERAFWMLYRRGMFKPMPKSLMDWIKKNDMSLDVEYEGPLAKAQRLQESVAVQRFFQIVLPISERNPEIMDNVDLDEMTMLHAVSVGVPERIMRDPKKRNKLREDRAAAQAEDRQRQQAIDAATSLGKAAPALKALHEANMGGIMPAPGAVMGKPVEAAA